MANGIKNHMFSTTWFMLFSGMISKAYCLEYDFEGNAVPIEITADTGATLQLSSDHHKKGSKSLKWQWTASANKLTWDLQSAAVQSERNGGIKMWIYNSNPSEKCLSVCIRERSSSSRKKSCFPISLNFQRWRAIWVAYREFRGCTSNSPTFNPTSNYNGWSVFRFVITAPSRSGSRGTLYFDLLRFERTVTRQTRDSVVPPLSYNRPPTAALRCTDCDKISAGFSVEDALAFHERKNFWQQIFRWSLVSPPDPQSTVATARLTDIRDKISRRLLNWYANESTTFTQIPRPDPIPNVFLTKRWYSLLKNIDTAHEEFQEFTTVVGGDRKLTSGLFSRNSKYGRRQTVDEEKKFSSILYLVLHPLALEYFIKSRSNEVDHAACEFAKIYTCTPNRNVRKNHVKEITGKDAELRAAFTSQYSPDSTIASSPHLPTCSGVSQACLDHVKAAINFVNEKRKEKILAIFDYIREQGFDEGSALGSNDHMPLGMSGFYHGAFLMKGELGATRLDYIIRTMKWYSDFGEIYQDPFEFKGTTADRVRTLMFFRLITVLVMPEGNDDQKKAKIRDMDALKSWINNALSINEGLGGLIKPDFTSFHHKTFYAGAYTPQALHTAALISYLLQGTAYELESEVRENVVNALKVFRIAAVHYSTPSSVGGRYPTYTKAILAEHVPGYAYLAANPSSTLPFTSLNTDLEEVSMFLRLYEHTTGTCDGPFNEELCKGKVDRKYYLNSLGSLEIMERVEALASSQAETSPEGHWCKQFGALSIHRRDDWAVTVKGFDKFVWDYESSNDENKYSMYASHGAMLIANSESALSSKDVENGWDWRKIPGTTVINAGFSNTLMPDEDRHYNGADDSMAGGVTLGGSTPSPRGIFGRNGVFGMRFVKPTYNAAYFSQVTFRFKKSVFFYDDVIVSLGSNIEYTAPPQRTDEVHTALFQDKMRTNTSPRTNPKIASADRCNDGGSANVKSSWGNAASVVLVDVNGNRYYVPNPDDQGLVFALNTVQNTVTEKGDASSGTYCTAWFNHGTSPSGDKAKYRYVVQVAAEPFGETGKDAVPSSFFEIIQQDANAHVVKFPSTNGRGDVHGYVVFPVVPSHLTFSGGPLSSVSDQSIIMVEKKTEPDKLYVSVTSPQLKLTKESGSPSWCSSGTTSPSANSDVDETLLYCSKSAAQQVRVNLRTAPSTAQSLHVGGKDKTSEKNDFLTVGSPATQLTFINLRNGADTEVSF